MLPALAVRRLRWPARRLALAAAGIVLVLAGAITSLAGSSSPPPRSAIADALRPDSWAMTIPIAWLAAPPPRARPGDAFDILALRSGERPIAAPVAYAVVLMASDERGLTVQVDQDDAVALANARGAGMIFVALLRSTR